MAVSVHNQLDAAKDQLDRAIKLFFDEADYYSAVTLAGASEEIFGKMLEDRKQKHALASLSSAITEIFIANDVPTLANREVVTQVSEVRDWLKHYKRGKDLEFDAKESAAELVDRAVSNYYQLTGERTTEMIRFTTYTE